jgi:ribonucleoside-diphosphate reductase subunit M2
VNNNLSEDKVRKIVCDVVDIEREFVCDAHPCDLVGMNSNLMSQYIDFVVDRLLVSILSSSIFCINQNHCIHIFMIDVMMVL